MLSRIDSIMLPCTLQAQPVCKLVHQHFLQCGSIAPTPTKISKTKKTDAGIEEVRSLVTENRVDSLRKIALHSSSSLATIWKILRYDLKFKFYRITSEQPLKDTHKQMISIHKGTWHHLASAQSRSQPSWISFLGCYPKSGLFSKTRNILIILLIVLEVSLSHTTKIKSGTFWSDRDSACVPMGGHFQHLLYRDQLCDIIVLGQ